MSELMIFQNPEFGKIRTVEVDGEPWLVGKDVAHVLGYVNPRKAFADHVDDEDKRQDDGVTIRDSMGREQHPTIINESGLYSLVLGSKLPGAKRFRRWVTNEVLPSIRKTGKYATQNPQQPEALQEARPRTMTPDDYITAARLVSGCRNDRLPYVLGFLERAGLDIPQVQAITSEGCDGQGVGQSTYLRLELVDFF